MAPGPPPPTGLPPPRSGGKLSLQQALTIAWDIARGLEELHGLGVAVLDLKPDNVLITTQGTALLTDFGISRITSNTVGNTVQTSVAGTFNYM